MTEYTVYPRPDTVATGKEPATIGELIEAWSREAEERRENEKKRIDEIRNHPPRTFGEWLDRY